MRHVVFVSSTLALLTACAADAPTRAGRANLMASAKSLTGRDLVEDVDGPWVVRRFEPESSDGTDEAPMAEGKRVARFDKGVAAEPTGEAVVEELEVLDSLEPDSAPRPEASLAFDLAETDGVADSRELAVSHSRAAPRTAGRGRADMPMPVLKAGSTDDNADFDAFLEFLAAQKENGTLTNCQELDVSRRRAIRVLDTDGTPVPAAKVRVVDADRDVVLWHGSTYGDGRVPFYPSLMPADASTTYLLEIEHDGRTMRDAWNGRGEEHVVRLADGPVARDEVEVDVVFLIDTTGSMSDEIERIKASLLATTQKLRNVDREFDLRYGAVLYRDVNDQYVTKAHAFTPDIEAFDEALQSIDAGGGGDTPESLNQGLAVAVDGMEWRDRAAKLVFLVADAPPHMDYEGDVPYGDSARAAIARGIKVHAVAASGLDSTGTTVFRQIAQLTRGRFIFIEYGGSVAKTAEGHGVAGEVKSNNLDDILFEQIRDEIATWGRDA